MRIYSSAIWLSSASLASIAVASGITFDTAGFNGATVHFNGTTYQSTILSSSQIHDGNEQGHWLITWKTTETSNSLTVKSVVLAAEKDPHIPIAYGANSSASTASGTTRLLFRRSTPNFLVDFTGGSLTLGPDFVNTALSNSQETPLFFQVNWTDNEGSGYSYSLPWAVADSSEATQMLSKWPSLVTSGPPAYTGGPSPIVPTWALPTTTGIEFSSDASSSSSMSTAATASSSAGSSGSKGSGKGKSAGLSTGAIVGIVVGVVAALVIASLIAGCFCFRRRRRNNANGEDGGRDAHAMQDMIAEKEARVGILEGDQPDTPYSERAPPSQPGRGLGLTGMNESGVDMGIGHAVPGDAAVPCEGRYITGNDRNSGVYVPIGGVPDSSAMGAPAPASSNNSSPTHTHPSSSLHERPSVPCASAQPDHAYAPYADHPVPGTAGGAMSPQQQQQQYEYGQHHHVVDGETPVHQEHSNEDHQPISPDSARGSAGGTPRMRGAAFGSRSATPSGISGRYAHLVEDGMTCDEIRRLEEEERALDEAIEQHGRGR